MANPRTQDGHARIANELIRCGFAKVNLSPYEWRILWAVIGLSWSWGRSGGYSSFREIAGKAGLSLRHAHRAVQGLIDKFILITRTGYKKTWFELNQDYETWRVDNLSVSEKLFNPPLPIEGTESVTCTGNGDSSETLEPQEIQALLKQFIKTIA